MALDFHLEKNRKVAESTRPLFSMELRNHKSLFEYGRLKREKYPLLFKLEDFYADAKYTIDELPRLNDEVSELKKSCCYDSREFKFLENMLSMLQEAQDKNMNIWVFCD